MGVLEMNLELVRNVGSSSLISKDVIDNGTEASKSPTVKLHS